LTFQLLQLILRSDDIVGTDDFAELGPYPFHRGFRVFELEDPNALQSICAVEMQCIALRAIPLYL